jgi:hypothetical protein
MMAGAPRRLAGGEWRTVEVMQTNLIWALAWMVLIMHVGILASMVGNQQGL